MTFRTIAFGSAEFQMECALRNKVLRRPLGLDLYDEDLSQEATQMHFGLFDQNNGLIACVVAIKQSPTEAKIRQMAVNPENVGQGHGRAIIELMEDYLVGRGIKQLSMHARVSALGFYKKLGYEQVGEEFTEVGIPHIKMQKPITLAYQPQAIKA